MYDGDDGFVWAHSCLTRLGHVGSHGTLDTGSSERLRHW